MIIKGRNDIRIKLKSGNESLAKDAASTIIKEIRKKGSAIRGPFILKQRSTEVTIELIDPKAEAVESLLMMALPEGVDISLKPIGF